MRTSYYQHGIPSNLRFVKVTGEDGTFYDLVERYDIKEHVKNLTDGGYIAVAVPKTAVPDCIYRDFSNGLGSYTEGSINGSETFYIKSSDDSETEEEL